VSCLTQNWCQAVLFASARFSVVFEENIFGIRRKNKSATLKPEI
jgi:hypothetical protein